MRADNDNDDGANATTTSSSSFTSSSSSLDFNGRWHPGGGASVSSASTLAPPPYPNGGWGQRGGGRHVYDCLLACALTSERIHGIPACNRRPSTDPAAGSESLERQTSSERWSTHFTHFPLHVREKKNPGVVSLTVAAKLCC